MSEAKSRSDERLSGPIAGCSDAKREDGQRSDEVNRVVVRAERGCHTCRYRIYDVLEEPCASCNFSLADKWQPRGERSEAIAQRSGPDNAEAHVRRGSTVP